MTSYNFGDFQGTSLGLNDAQSLPGLGYKAVDGEFYVGDNQTSRELTVVAFAMRQCKEVTRSDGVTIRYPIFTRRDAMDSGDVEFRMQVACLPYVPGVLNEDELHVFGARSYVTVQSWLNPPATSDFHIVNMELGIWHQLRNHILKVKSEHGVQTAPLCWRMKLVPAEKQIMVGTIKKKAVYPIALGNIKPDTQFEFVGQELVALYQEIYRQNDLDKWKAEWEGTITHNVESEYENKSESEYQPQSPDDLPF